MGSAFGLSSNRWTRVVAAVFSSFVRRFDGGGDDDRFFLIERVVVFAGW